MSPLTSLIVSAIAKATNISVFYAFNRKVSKVYVELALIIYVVYTYVV